MNNIKQSHDSQGGPDRDGVQKDHRPYWKRAHQDWRVWAAVFLMIAAMIVYVMSDDLALRLRSRPQQTPPGTLGK